MPDTIAFQDKTSLAALIGSRICHDLISPIGAISNGLELVTLSNAGADSPEMDLIQQSCDNATARIRFFRIAFGSASDNRPVTAAEADRTLVEHYAGTRIEPVWDIDAHLPRNTVQLGYLVLLCIETALPQGGRVSARFDDGAFHVSARGPSVVEDPALWSVLEDGSETRCVDLRPSHVQFGLLAHLCADAGLRVSAVFEPDAVQVAIPLQK